MCESFDFAVTVDGNVLMTGDESSIGIIYNNLTGRNFAKKTNAEAEHKGWLVYMTATYDTPLPVLGEIKMLSPTGILLRYGSIGDGLMRPDPVIGEEYMVKVYPMGASPVWHKTRYVGHEPATPISREKFNFNAGHGCFVVTREQLEDRVMPLTRC